MRSGCWASRRSRRSDNASVLTVMERGLVGLAPSGIRVLNLYGRCLPTRPMHPPQRIVTNIPRAQVNQAMRELEQSIEVDRAEIGHYQILEQMLSATSLTAIGGAAVSMSTDIALREKDQVKGLLQGLVRMEYDEINGKQGVLSFLRRLMTYTN
jgi:hypothetical protein